MPMYRTQYALPTGTPIHTQCFAENDKHLAEVIALRGMNETRADPFWFDIAIPKMASALVLAGKLAAANHALVWTAMIAARAGIADAWGMLNDSGILHDMAHELETVEIEKAERGGFLFFAAMPTTRQAALARRIEAFERLVPGVHPCWAGEDSRSIVKVLEEQKRAEEHARDGLYPYQRDMMDALLGGFSGMGKSMQAVNRSVLLTTDSMALLNIGHYREQEVLNRKAEAPRAKPDSRKFADHQRQQGQAVRDAKKPDLVAKLKKNLSGETKHEKSVLRLIKEDKFGTTPPGDAGRIRSSKSIHSTIYDKNAVMKVNGKEVPIVNGSLTIDIETTGFVMGVDPAGKDGDISVAVVATRQHDNDVFKDIPFKPAPDGKTYTYTGRQRSSEPVVYHMTREGPPIRMRGGEPADQEDRDRLDMSMMQALIRKKEDDISRMMMRGLINVPV